MVSSVTSFCFWMIHQPVPHKHTKAINLRAYEKFWLSCFIVVSSFYKCLLCLLITFSNAFVILLALCHTSNECSMVFKVGSVPTQLKIKIEKTSICVIERRKSRGVNMHKHLCSDTCTYAYYLGLSNSLLLWLVGKADKIKNNEDNGYLTSN